MSSFFIRNATCADAIQFDGTRESAKAVHAMFPFKIARHIERDDVLMMADRSDMTTVGAGEWVVLDHGHGLRVLPDDLFRQSYRPSVLEWAK